MKAARLVPDTRAREGWAEHYESRIIAIVDDVLAGEIEPQAARTAIDAIKWIMCKAAPKFYGDRQEIDHKNSDGSLRPAPAIDLGGLTGETLDRLEKVLFRGPAGPPAGGK